MYSYNKRLCGGRLNDVHYFFTAKENMLACLSRLLFVMLLIFAHAYSGGLLSEVALTRAPLQIQRKETEPRTKVKGVGGCERPVCQNRAESTRYEYTKINNVIIES